MKNSIRYRKTIPEALGSKGKRERREYLILTVIFFILSAFTFWEMVYEICNMLGSIVSGTPAQALEELKRMLPVLLTGVAYIAVSINLTGSYMAYGEQHRANKFNLIGILSIILGAAISGYILFGLYSGQYAELVEGYVSPLFPLDVLLGGLIIIVMGVKSIRHALNVKAHNSFIPYETDKKNLVVKFVDTILYTIAYLAGAAGFAACFYGIFVMDFAHGNIFFNIMLWLNYFTAFAMVAVYRFIYVETEKEYRPETAKKLGVIFLIINIVLFALYLVSVQLQNEAPNLNAFGILPIEFTASFNAFAPIYGLNNILVPLIALIKGTIRNIKEKEILKD